MNPIQGDQLRSLQHEENPLQGQQTVQIPQEETSSVKRQKICQVCHDNAPTFHLNYGVSTCLGCRAFFRRTVQKGPDSLRPCRNGDVCKVTTKTRTQCQKCRYMKCLRVGMQAQMVMDEGQKKERFRKMLKKRKRKVKKTKDPLQCATFVVNRIVFSKRGQSHKRQKKGKEKCITRNSELGLFLGSKLSSVETEADQLCHEQKLVKKDSIKDIVVADGSSRNVIHKTQEKSSNNCKYGTACILHQDSRTILPRELTNNHLRIRKRMIKRVQMIRHSWTAALKLGTDTSSQFVQDLLHSHLGQFSLSKSALKSHLMSLAAVFRYFALQQPEFADLPFLDQHRLLCRNVPTFVQFAISMYLSAEDPKDQINWMMLHSHLKIEYDPKKLHFMSLFVLNDRLSLFKGDCCQYLSQLDTLCLIRPLLSLDEVPFFALGCLFSPSHSSLLDKTGIVYDHQLNIKTLIRWKHEVYGGASFEDLSKALLAVERMTDIFERMVDWESESNDYLFSFYSMPIYNMDSLEHNWLQSQFDSFYKCFVSVSCGEGFVRQYLLAVQQHVVPGSAFSLQAVAILTERARRLLKNQEGFNCMSSQRQASILGSKSIADALIMQSIKVQGCQTGVEQIKYLFGSKDNALLEDNEITTLFQGWHVKRMEAEHVIGSNNLISKAAIQRMTSLSTEICHDLRDVNMFMLFMYALMFSHEQAPSLHHRYIRHLVQLRSDELKKNKETESVEDGMEWYGRIMKKFQEVENILTKYLTNIAPAGPASKMAEGQHQDILPETQY